MNMLPGELSGGQLRVGDREPVDAVAAGWAARDSRDGAVTVAFRPEYARVVEEGPLAFKGEVETSENLGASVLITARTSDDHRVQAVVPEGSEPEPGAAVCISPVPGRVLVYDESGELLAS